MNDRQPPDHTWCDRDFVILLDWSIRRPTMHAMVKLDSTDDCATHQAVTFCGRRECEHSSVLRLDHAEQFCAPCKACALAWAAHGMDFAHVGWTVPLRLAPEFDDSPIVLD